MSLRIKLISFLFIGIIPLIGLGVLEFYLADQALRVVQNGGKAAVIERAKDQLVSVRDSRKNQILSYLERVKKDIILLGENPFVHQGVQSFQKVFSENIGGSQAEQLLSNSEYLKVHQNYHAYFKRYIDVYEFYDLFLFDLQGNLVYTVAKEKDFATNLVEGIYQDSGLGLVYRKAKAIPRTIAFHDFTPYSPSNGDPAAFIATSIQNRSGKTIGVVGLQFSEKAISKVMGETSGLGKTGETYLVGMDHYPRSNSRLNTKLTVKNSFKNKKKISTEAIQKAFQGQSDVEEILDYRNTSVLSAYTSIQYEGITWALMAEIDIAEAYEEAEKLTRAQGSDIEAAEEKLLQYTGALVFFSSIIGIIFFIIINRQISHSLTKIENMAEEVTLAADQLSQRAQVQSYSIEQMTSSSEEMISTIQDVAANASNVSTAAHNSTIQVNEGGEAVQKSIDFMGLISESSSHINEIIRVISDIAEQTNLLALNASIEAARAGEHGKGFAIVADAVRKLAERSAKSTQEITILIKESKQRVEQGSDSSDNAGKVLKEIIKDVNKTADLIEQISATTEEQAATSQAIQEHMEKISDAVDENSKASDGLSNLAFSMMNEIKRVISGKKGTSKQSFQSAPLHLAQTTAPLKALSEEKQSALDSSEKNNYLSW